MYFITPLNEVKPFLENPDLFLSSKEKYKRLKAIQQQLR